MMKAMALLAAWVQLFLADLVGSAIRQGQLGDPRVMAAIE